MKVLVQWARRNPRDWDEIEPSEWAALPSRPVPRSGEIGGLDNRDGWVVDVSCQGWKSNDDHIVVEPATVNGEDAVIITGWNDDPEEWPVGTRYGYVRTFLPLAPDPHFGHINGEDLRRGILYETENWPEKRIELLLHIENPENWPINTRQFQVYYCEGEKFDRMSADPPQNTTVRRYSEFVPPPEAMQRHGILMAREKYEEHLQRRRVESWREWVDHLSDDEVELRSGRRVLKGQRDRGRFRKTARTITYYQRDTDRAAGWITATHEDALETTAGTGQTESVTTNGTTTIGWGFSTPANEPNVTDWPNGTYNGQFDVSSASVDSYYPSTNAVSARSEFHKLASDLSAVNEIDTEFVSAFSGTGLKAFANTWDPASGSAGDRFGIAMILIGGMHGAELTLTFDADAYTDGPWSIGPTFHEQGTLGRPYGYIGQSQMNQLLPL